MLNFISIVLILIIFIFLFIYKKNYMLNILTKKKKINNKSYEINFDKSVKLKFPKNIGFNSTRIYSNLEKYHLRKEMFNLFKGSKNQKIKALEIAKKLSDKSTLKILKLGLKDMDLEIVKISATLIEKFKH